jgi:hypothetical protein
MRRQPGDIKDRREQALLYLLDLLEYLGIPHSYLDQLSWAKVERMVNRSLGI